MSSELTRGSVPSVAPVAGSAILNLLARACRYLEAAIVVAGERRRLASLDDRALADIGLSRATAEREARRDFLDVPAHRVRRR